MLILLSLTVIQQVLASLLVPLAYYEVLTEV
jgi:hypothetical protein